MKKVAYIHESLTGQWHITDDSLDYLDEGGQSYQSKREAIAAAREGDWTHYNATGRIVRL